LNFVQRQKNRSFANNLVVIAAAGIVHFHKDYTCAVFSFFDLAGIKLILPYFTGIPGINSNIVFV
jgi:hypothetical protein